MKKKVWILIGAVIGTALLAGGIVGGVVWWKKQPPKSEPVFDASFFAQNESKKECATLQRLVKQAQPINWLFAGDSLTQGSMHTHYRRNFSQLFRQYIRTVPIDGVLRQDDIVLNTGVSSGTTGHMMQYFDQWLAAPNPDVVFLCIGMNDCTAEGMTVTRYRENLNQVIDWMREQGIILVLQTPNGSAREKQIAPYLDAIRSIAAQREVLLVDFNLYWQQNQGQLKKMMSDPIHPNEAGHLTWCRFLLRSLGMLEDESQLALMPYKEVAGMVKWEHTAAIPEVNLDARDKLRAGLSASQPAVWVFLGGTATEGLTASLNERNYVEHFEEVARWETQTQRLVGRCKSFVNSGKKGMTISGMLEQYETLAGQFTPDVVSILPELDMIAGEDGTMALQNFAADLLELVCKAQEEGAAVLLQTPFAQGEKARAMRGIVLEIARQTGSACIDQFILLEEMTQNHPTARALLLDESGVATAGGHYWMGRNLAFQLTDPPANSRMR